MEKKIKELLTQLQGTEQELAAFAALQQFRKEALVSARVGATEEVKWQMIEEARARLKERLRALLG